MLKLFKVFYWVFCYICEGVVIFFFLLFVMISFVFVLLFSLFNGKVEIEVMLIFDYGVLVFNLNGYLVDNCEEYFDFYCLLEVEMGNE